MKGSLLVEIHNWKGFGSEHDLFAIGLKSGFVTVYVSRVSLIETINELKAKLEQMQRLLGGKS